MSEKQINKEHPFQPEVSPDKQRDKKETIISPEKEKELEKQQEQQETEKSINNASSLPISVFKKDSVKNQETIDKQKILLQDIENILSEDIKDYYELMNEQERKNFKEKGEKTAVKIRLMIDQAKVVVYKVVGLIKRWLLIIPGVNKYFLEQETKIKTDKILELAKERKNKKLK